MPSVLVIPSHSASRIVAPTSVKTDHRSSPTNVIARRQLGAGLTGYGTLEVSTSSPFSTSRSSCFRMDPKFRPRYAMKNTKMRAVIA